VGVERAEVEGARIDRDFCQITGEDGAQAPAPIVTGVAEV
jgi:hypothetical protein